MTLALFPGLPGDVATGPGWQLNRGDCLQLMAALPDDSVDVVITDPPYSQHTHARTWQAKTLGRPTVYDGIDFAHLTADQAYEVAGQARRLCRRWFAAFTDIEGIALWKDAVLNAGLDIQEPCNEAIYEIVLEREVV